jgi:hypothetical protein
MANLIDYLDWRGDLSFKQADFNDVDALVLCQISYMNFDSILTDDFKNVKTIKELWEEFSSHSDFSNRSKMGAMINPASVTLLEKAGKSKRFGSILAGGYVSRIDLKREEQFSAITFFRKKARFEPFVAFRGTDDTLVGWKEDFNMIIDTIPSQKDALEYLTRVAKNTFGKMYVSGHSKGGNAAMYASAFINRKYQRRIKKVYNNDGPGFSKEIIATPEIKRLTKVLHSFYPQFSVVGMLFEHVGDYTVIESDDRGVMQHDPFSWHVTPCDFVTLPGLTKQTVAFHKTFNAWIESIPMENRKVFVDTFFKVLEVTDAKTNTELEANWLKNAGKIIKALNSIDKETRDQVLGVIDLLFKVVQKNIPVIKGLEFFSNLVKKYKGKAISEKLQKMKTQH